MLRSHSIVASSYTKVATAVGVMTENTWRWSRLSKQINWE